MAQMEWLISKVIEVQLDLLHLDERGGRCNGLYPPCVRLPFCLVSPHLTFAFGGLRSGASSRSPYCRIVRRQVLKWRRQGSNRVYAERGANRTKVRGGVWCRRVPGRRRTEGKRARHGLPPRHVAQALDLQGQTYQFPLAYIVSRPRIPNRG